MNNKSNKIILSFSSESHIKKPSSLPRQKTLNQEVVNPISKKVN
jgi:hypothetical protein